MRLVCLGIDPRELTWEPRAAPEPNASGRNDGTGAAYSVRAPEGKSGRTHDKSHEVIIMNVSHSLFAAAVGGILMGAAACGGETPPPATPAGATPATETAAPAGGATPQTAGATPGKHACKGQNDCKGQGGCKTDKHGCKGQNDCKGQGGCKTA